jgi:cytochrome c-type biogenesis protein CcmH/NrfF
MDWFNFFLQEGPAETTNYMLLGYGVIFLVLGIYIASLYIRSRNLKRDARLLEELEASAA